MAPATSVLGCPSCDGIRLRALLTPASSGALVARGRAGRDGQAAGRLSLAAAGPDSGVLDALRAASASTIELAQRTADGDAELPEANVRSRGCWRPVCWSGIGRPVAAFPARGRPMPDQHT